MVSMNLDQNLLTDTKDSSGRNLVIIITQIIRNIKDRMVAKVGCIIK